MYEVIVLGATFAAAGIAHKCKDKCLVLEHRVQAGYEFFGALQFGSGYEKEIKCADALALYESFSQESAGFYGCDAHIYPYFKDCHAIFGAQVVSVEKCDGGFVCVAHGVSGFCTYKAKRIIDTRCNAEMSVSKTYNLLIASEETPAYDNVHYYKAGGENRYVLRCPVPLDCGYAEARTIAKKLIQDFKETQRLILSADEFDYQVKKEYPQERNGILYLPSKAYENPIRAFEAGVTMAQEVGK